MENSPFNKLSAEIRNEIYELALTSEKHLSTYNGSAVQAPLTRVCKQIRSESLLLFYSLNTFTSDIAAEQSYSDGGNNGPGARFFDSVLRAVEWAKSTPNECNQAIKSLVFTMKISYHSFGNGVLWNSRKDTFRYLRDELVRKSYDMERVVVRVAKENATSFTMHGGTFSRIPDGDPTTMIMSYFQEVGFKCEIIEREPELEWLFD